MPSTDEIWGWLYEPIQELKKEIAAAPDRPWETHRESFLNELHLSTADQDPVIEELLHHLEDMPAADRNNFIGSDQFDNLVYGLAQKHGVDAAPVAAADQAHAAAQEQAQHTGTAEPSYDEQRWQEFLETNGPRWDGTAESWDPFREWFLYYAREAGFEVPATSLLDYLTAQGVADRITTLAAYRVVITPGHAGQAAEPEAIDPEMDELMARLIDENPEYADIPEERRREIIAEVLREEQDEED